MTVAPIRREFLVPATPEVAFDVFTSSIGRWWPVEKFSVSGAGADVAFTTREIVETSTTGERSIWGTVTRWEPGNAVAFTWHPGNSAEKASHVEVTFSEKGEDTLVVLEHSGWEVFENPEMARSEYEQGWPVVTGRYEEAVREQSSETPSSRGDQDGFTYVALLHTPSADAPKGEALFEDPRFGQHVAFLKRMHASGYLFAAGPMMDKPGDGMTILRIPGRDQLELATRLATKDDESVAGGFFDVAIRPWNVQLPG